MRTEPQGRWPRGARSSVGAWRASVQTARDAGKVDPTYGAQVGGRASPLSFPASALVLPGQWLRDQPSSSSVLDSGHHSLWQRHGGAIGHTEWVSNSFLILFVSLHQGFTRDFVKTRNCTPVKSPIHIFRFRHLLLRRSRDPIKMTTRPPASEPRHRREPRRCLARETPRGCVCENVRHHVPDLGRDLLTCCRIFPGSSCSLFQTSFWGSRDSFVLFPGTIAVRS